MQSEEARLICTVIRHRDYVREGLGRIIHELERRALLHDISKFSSEAFDGFVTAQKGLSEGVGSSSYNQNLLTEAIQLHYKNNDHHPEHFGLGKDGYTHSEVPKKMNFFQILEMCADWVAAWKTYGAQGSWKESFEKMRGRFFESFNDTEWVFIEDICNYLIGDNNEET